jgi:hypothetical protein
MYHFCTMAYAGIVKGKMIMVPRSAADKQDLVSRRTAKRYRVSGIVALANSGQPVVMRLYDIARNGVSFLHASDWLSAGDEVVMDILIFDVKSNDEHFLNWVTGKVLSTDWIADPERKRPILRTRVTFQKLDVLQQEILHTFLTHISQSGTEMKGDSASHPEEGHESLYVRPGDNRSLVYRKSLNEENPDENAGSQKVSQEKRRGDWKND